MGAKTSELAEPHSFLRTEYRGFAKIKEENIKELVKVHGSVDDFINRSFGVRDKVETKSDHWSEAECYFAVWAYDQLDVDRGQVKKELYRQISATIGRSEKAVEYKVQNVAFFDGRPREEKPVPEAPHAQALLREVFEWYWADRERARSLFPDYFQQFQFGMASPPHAGSAPTKKDLLSLVIEEGAPGFPASARRKRSRTLLEQGRSHFREAEPDGKLRCAVCSFATPEGVEAEIVQLHHTEPLYGLGKRGTSMGLSEAISKLIPLCPTCHQIAHVEKPPLTVGAIEKLRDP